MADETTTNTQTPAQTNATNTQTPTLTNGNGGDQQPGSETLTFDKWLATQPDNIKDLLDDHTGGLKSALDDERRERKSLAARLKELGKQADNGSELQKQLQELTGNLTAADTKATFYEDAHEAGVKNLRLAWMAAKEYDLIDGKGKVNFDQLKTFAPELFSAVKFVPNGNAGNGAQQKGVQAPDMNRAIRVMAGRQG